MPTDPTPRLREQDKLLSNRHRSEDVIIKSMSKKLLAGSQELFDRAQSRIMRLDLDALGNIKQTNKNLKAVEDINTFIAQGADLITNKAIKELKEGTAELEGFYDDELKSLNTGLPNDTLARIPGLAQTEAVRNTNLKNMSAVSSSFTQEVRRQLTSTLFENKGPEEMVKELKKHLIGKKDKRGNPMTRHADTLARTAYNAYAGAITLQNADLDETVAFYYSGPDDRRTRSFCAARVGQVIAKEELTEAIGAQTGASLHNPGGFNCRHKIFPISMFDPEAVEFLSDEQRKIVRAAGGVVDEPKTKTKKKAKKRTKAAGGVQTEALYKKQHSKGRKVIGSQVQLNQDDSLFTEKNVFDKGDFLKKPQVQDTRNALMSLANAGRKGEAAAFMDNKGKIIGGLVVKGAKSYVTGVDIQRIQLEGNVQSVKNVSFVHNHPNNSTFSGLDGDLGYFALIKAQGVDLKHAVVFNNNGSGYSLKIPKDYDRSAAGWLSDSYRNQLTLKQPKYQKIYFQELEKAALDPALVTFKDRQKIKKEIGARIWEDKSHEAMTDAVDWYNEKYAEPFENSKGKQLKVEYRKVTGE